MIIYCGYDLGVNWERSEFTSEELAREFTTSLRKGARRPTYIVVDGSWGLYQFVTEVWYVPEVFWFHENTIQAGKASSCLRIQRHWQQISREAKVIIYHHREDDPPTPHHQYTKHIPK